MAIPGYTLRLLRVIYTSRTAAEMETTLNTLRQTLEASPFLRPLLPKNPSLYRLPRRQLRITIRKSSTQPQVMNVWATMENYRLSSRIPFLEGVVGALFAFSDALHTECYPSRFSRFPVLCNVPSCWLSLWSSIVSIRVTVRRDLLPMSLSMALSSQYDMEYWFSNDEVGYSCYHACIYIDIYVTCLTSLLQPNGSGFKRRNRQPSSVRDALSAEDSLRQTRNRLKIPLLLRRRFRGV